MIRVACADDSAFLRQILKEVLESSGKIQVVGQLKNGKEALEFAKTQKPDLMILDCEMPVMNGLEALRRIMQEAPLPVVMFSSLTSEGAAVTIKALEYGAMDFLLKPTSNVNRLEEVAETLIGKIELIAARRQFMGLGSQDHRVAAGTVDLKTIPARTIDLIALGSSTGGVQAAMALLPKLPKDTPPIVWVQHMPEHFTKSFADRLNGICQMGVKEMEDGDVVTRGQVYLGRGGRQMIVASEGLKLKVRFAGSEKVNGFCPSCNVLFDSVAQYYGANALGIILTGMGNDGTEGLVKMHRKGSYVLGQDQMTSTVYGMPRTAFEAGAVNVQLPIERMAEGVIKVCGLSA